jgi:hypothetical protein
MDVCKPMVFKSDGDSNDCLAGDYSYTSLASARCRGNRSIRASNGGLF